MSNCKILYRKVGTQIYKKSTKEENEIIPKFSLVKDKTCHTTDKNEKKVRVNHNLFVLQTDYIIKIGNSLTKGSTLKLTSYASYSRLHRLSSLCLYPKKPPL